MKKLFLILAIIFASTCIYADLLIKKDGTEINGKIIKYSNGSLIFHDSENNIDKSFKTSDLTRLDVFKEYSVPGVFSADKIKEKDVRTLIKADYSKYSIFPRTTIFSRYKININENGSADFNYHYLGKVFKAPGKTIGTFYINYIPGKYDYKINFARSITKDNVVYANDYSVTDSAVYPSYPLYNKAKQVKVIIPKVEVGSFVEYSYNIHYNSLDELNNPMNLSLTTMVSSPLLESNAHIIVPASMAYIAFTKNTLSKDKVLNISKKGKNTIIDYTKKNIAPYQVEDNIPPAFDVFPSFYFSLKYSYSSIADRLAKKFKEKSNISKSLLSEFRKIYSSKKTKEQKLIAVYDFITKQINTAGVSLSLTQYYPMDPQKIFDGRLGSIVDKTFLCYLMLNDIGINSNIVFLHSRSSGKLESRSPAINQFGSIALMLDDGKMMYLGSSSMRLYSIPTAYQGSKALSLKDRKIIDTPLLPRVETDDYDFYIDKKGTLKADVRSTYQGNIQNSLRSYIYYSKKELDQSWQKRVASIHPNASLISYSLKNLKDLSKDVSIEYKYNIKDFPKKAGNKMMAFKIPDFYIFNESHIAKKTRSYPIFYSGKYKNIYNYKISIPNGYRFAYFPENISTNIDGMSFTAEFSDSSDSLNIRIVFQRDHQVFDKKDYSNYRKFVKKITKLQQDWLIIEKI